MFWNHIKNKEKNCIVKQYFISIGNFTTQLDAFRIAEKIQEVCKLPELMISVNESYLELSQSEYDKYLDKVQKAKYLYHKQ